MSQPDPRRSRAVLVGASKYEQLDDIPAVENNLKALAACLRDSELWGLSEDNCRVVPEPNSPRKVAKAVRAAGKEATDALLVYYSGHGLLHTRTSELLLSLPDADKDEPATAASYNDCVRLPLLDSRARCRIVILDCCFSGRALGILGDSTTVVADSAVIDGTFLLASARENSPALAPPGDTYTAFTGALIQLLEHGMEDGPELLDLDTIYRHTRDELLRRSFPEPQVRERNLAGKIQLVRNRACATVPRLDSTRGPRSRTRSAADATLRVQGLRTGWADLDGDSSVSAEEPYKHVSTAGEADGVGSVDMARNAAPDDPGTAPPVNPPPRYRRLRRLALAAVLVAVVALVATLTKFQGGGDDARAESGGNSPAPGDSRSDGGGDAAARKKEDGRPTVLEAARSECAPSSGNVRPGDNGYTLIIDRALAEENPGVDIDELNCIFNRVEVPDSVRSRMAYTSAVSGLQEADFNGFSVFWRYSPDDGFSMTISEEQSWVGQCLGYVPDVVGEGFGLVDCGGPEAFWEVTAQSFDIDAEVDDEGRLVDNQAAYDLCGEGYGASYLGEVWTNWRYVYSSGRVDSLYCVKALGNPDPESDMRTPYMPDEGACIDDSQDWWTVDCDASEAIYEVVGTVKFEQARELTADEAADEATCGGQYYWEVTDVDGRTTAILCGNELRPSSR